MRGSSRLPRSGAPTEGELGVVLDFMKLLWAVDHGLQSASKRMRSTLGVTGPQRLVVRLVGRFPRSTAGALAATLHIHPSTLTGVLQRLESKGLIQREVDPEDARRARFLLTPRGKKVDNRQAGTVESIVRRLLEKAPAGELKGARSLLRRLAAELDRETLGPPPAAQRASKRARRNPLLVTSSRTVDEVSAASSSAHWKPQR